MVPRPNASLFLGGMLCAFIVAGGAGGRSAFAETRGNVPDVEILSARTVLKDKVYYLNAHFRVHLKPQMIEALHAGIPLTFVVSVEVYHPRSYLWDDRVALLEQRYRLSYKTLTEQYGLENLNSGVENQFPTLVAATDVLGTIVDLPILDRALLDSRKTYRGGIRVRLEREDLPLPLRLQSYFYSGWTLASDWYTWPIRF